MRIALLAAAAFAGAAQTAVSAPYPPDAKPGECFARVREPAITRSETATRVVQPTRTVVKTVPGSCREETKVEVVRPASMRTVETPATYKTVAVPVTVRPPGVRTVVVPALVETRIVPVIVGYGPVQPAGEEDDGTPPYGADPDAAPRGPRARCAEPLAPIYAPMAYPVVRRPAQLLQTPIPPVVVTETRTVVDVPAHQETVSVPEETRRVSRTICDPPATVRETFPEQVEKETRTVIVQPARFAWVRIDCDGAGHKAEPPPCPGACEPAAPASSTGAAARRYPKASSVPPVGDRKVAQLQRALSATGYYDGPSNGLFTPETLSAMTRFQHDRGLAEGRFTGETANALGLTP